MKIHSDNLPADDLLGRYELANRIALGLAHTTRSQTEGFVTGLTGKWGSGKTTLLAFLKKSIIERFSAEAIPHIIIEFNPWMLSENENIKVALLKELSKNLSQAPPKWKNVFLKHSNKLEHLEMVHSGLGKLAKEASSLLREYWDSTNSLVLKAKIDELLLTANKKIFIFLDDLDRLSPKQIFELFQALKLTAGFKNTYYIVAYDREAVEVAIETQFKDYGKKYLDKIIQADFLIPEIPDEKIESVLFNGLDSLISAFDIPYRSSMLSSVWLHRGLRLYFQTLRDVYRYLNSLQFSLPVIKDDVDVTDFLILEAIRLHDFDSYQRIYNELNQNNFRFGASVGFTKGERLKMFNGPTKTLIEFLFPESVIGSFHRIGINKRLYDSKNFSRYFTLQLTSTDVSELEFQHFMQATAERSDILKNVMTVNRLDNLMIRLSDSDLGKHYKNWDFSLVNDIFMFFNLHADEIESPHRIADVIINLLYQKDKEKEVYFKKFLDLLMTPTKEVDRARIYFYHFMLDSKENDNGFPNGATEFKNAYIDEFYKLELYYKKHLGEWKDYFLSIEIPNRFSYYTLLFFYDYSVYFLDDYRQRVLRLLHEPANIVFFLKNSLAISSDGLAGRLNMQQMNRLLPTGLSKRSFVEHLRNIDISRWSENEKEWRDFLLDAVKDETLLS